MKHALTYKQKQEIFEEFQRRKRDGEKGSQKFLAGWAMGRFSLSHAPNQGTISRILKQFSREDIPIKRFIKKRDRAGKCHAIEEALFGWICSQHAKILPVNGPAICNKGTRLQSLANTQLPEEQRTQIKFSAGWLGRFQARWGLRSFRALQKEEGDQAGQEEPLVNLNMDTIKKLLEGYNLDDIWVADEFGLFYNMAPSKTIARMQLTGVGKGHRRFSCLACCNASGNEKVPLMFIGSSSQPFCFRNKTGKELGLDYRGSHKTWVTAPLFFDWLLRFDHYISLKVDRKVVLIIDRCDAHGSERNVPELQSVKVIFLPPGTPAKTIALNTGIIGALKVRYRRLQLLRALDLNDCGSGDLYRVDQLTGMRWMSDIWQSLEENTIKTCWRRAGLLGDKLPKEAEEPKLVPSPKEVNAVDLLVSQVVSGLERMNTDSFLKPIGEDDCGGEKSEPDTVLEVVSRVRTGAQDGAGGTNTACQNELALPGIEKQLEAVAYVKILLETNYPMDRLLHERISSIQGGLRNSRLEAEGKPEAKTG